MKGALCILCLLWPTISQGRSLWVTTGNLVVVDQPLLQEISSNKTAQFSVPIDGKEVPVQVDVVAPSVAGMTSINGHMGKDPEAFFLLCALPNGAVTAFFQLGNGSVFRLDHTAGFAAVRAVDTEEFGACAGQLEAATFQTGNTPHHYQIAEPYTGPQKTGEVADDGSRHDIVVGYTPAAEAVAGGPDYILLEAQMAIDAANLVYANSNIPSRLRLVLVLGTTYDEATATKYSDHLNSLGYPHDGDMDNMLPARNLVGADFVTVLIDGQDANGETPICGIAPIMQPEQINPSFENLALSIVSVQCAVTNWSLAHEVGHNRGCAHDRNNAVYGGAYPYSYGYRFQGSDELYYRTVMAYDHPFIAHARIPYFSTPEVNYAGHPVGITPGFAEEADNALTQNNTAALCAGFRAERTFVQFGASGYTPDGLIRLPYFTISDAVDNSRLGSTIVLQNDNPGFAGVLNDPRSLVTDQSGSVVLGGS